MEEQNQNDQTALYELERQKAVIRDAVRDVAREIKGFAATHLMRHAGNDQSRVTLKNVHDLFLRMLVLGHAAAGIEFRDHLVH